MTREDESPSKWEARLGQRERQADERERKADERERTANERERKADERERTANEREHQVDQRERRLEELARELRDLATGASRETIEAIERFRTLADAGSERRARSREALERVAADAERQQAAIDRAVAQSERELAAPTAERDGPEERLRMLRKQVVAGGVAFAETEETAALIFEELAVQNPMRAHAYKRNAEQARGTARRIRELTNKFRH